jgi:hypothetical protein
MFSFRSLFFDLIPDWLLSFKFLRIPDKRSQKIHDYTKLNQGEDYLFETIEEGKQAIITGEGKSVNCGEYLILPDNSGSSRYQVESIEYYSNPADVWMALLIKVSDD